jgi:hypothetical protein
MAIFEGREREFEARFKQDQDLQFRVKARRNRMLGLWAAERMGLTGEAAQAYATEIVDAEFAGGDHRVVEKICADLTAKGQSCTPEQIRFELTHLGQTAKTQIMRE